METLKIKIVGELKSNKNTHQNITIIRLTMAQLIVNVLLAIDKAHTTGNIVTSQNNLHFAQQLRSIKVRNVKQWASNK